MHARALGDEAPMNSPFHFATIDWIIIGASIAISFLPALFFWKRASSSTTEFFTSGRAAPWWLVGISMVATTFSTDTPNLVTNLVREHGVAENWVWWSFLLTGMMTVFFYARLWRRSGVLTDLEFYEIRYSATSATGGWRSWRSSSRSRFSGGASGIPGRSPAAGATSRNGCSHRAPSRTPSPAHCSST